MRKSQKSFIVAVVVIAVVLLDQGSKHLAIQLLEGRGMVSFFHDIVRFLLVENPGGFLSIGASFSAGLRDIIFVLLTAVFLTGFSLFIIFNKKMASGVLVASSLIIGGGLGNLIDRAMRNGLVVDFVNMGIGRLRTGIFNVADMAVLCGCILLFFYMLSDCKVKGGVGAVSGK